MKKRFQRILSSFALVTITLVSLVSVCKQMFTICGFDCAQHEMSMSESIHRNMMDCSTNARACSSPSSDHMATFASLYPSTETDAWSAVLILCAVVVIAWSFNIKKDLLDAERLKAKIRNDLRSLAHSFTPNFLVLAFSRGVLHSKIYA